jgi:DNA polymerase elongation subunit (family B)
MKAQIYSIDDSVFGIWWMEKSLEELKEIRIELMNWINKENILNGEKFLDYCISLGADIDTKRL